ncbi:type VI secretion system ATPase TssH [uncultured Roseobacter sp.]|uniref:type VI secretion system ATPase TssH n=1 Tax=uncultured Roseobacter sp. TaxID=114847 RepID=UPI00262F14B1|nr:type VI secretion system ATPase TssH [uncultured Roseobacter sp.]
MTRLNVVTIDLHILFQRLSDTASAALEGAAALAVRHAHNSVELEHFVASLTQESAFAELLEKSGINPGQVNAEAMEAVQHFARGSSGAPSLSQPLISLSREAWLSASLRFNQERVSPAVLLLTLIAETELRAILRRAVPSLLALDTGVLEAAIKAEPTGATASARPRQPHQGDADFLADYAVDLTEQARAGQIDTIVGRDAELRQMIDILVRRRQNNPILVGEAGVGKTAIVEAFALAIARKEVPARLADVALHVLDLSLLQAGAGVKGEFERRLKGVVDQVVGSASPVILFIDEAHTMIGAGGAAGQGDAANILKPALARGELRTIAATTWSEYKKYFEKDPALSRRFQTVKVDEPDIERAVRMIRAVAPEFQGHHGVAIRDSAVRAAVELSARYLPERQLPDKAVSLIDTAGAAVSMSRETDPEALEQRRREAAYLRSEMDALAEEPETPGLADRMAGLKRDLDAAEAEAVTIAEALDQQRALADEADAMAAEDRPDRMVRLAEIEARLSEAGGETPLVHRVVDAEAIAGVIARWTGIPAGRMLRSQIDAVTRLPDRMKARVLGQDRAIDALCEQVSVSRAGLRDPRKPQGVFLMLGTSGIGKTETALTLADELHGGSSALTVINMSEFKEEHKVSLLMGSPPGYVGYGEGGVLTEAVRRRPHGILLLDEIDKAHEGVQEIFYQVFDKGVLRDGEGRDVDFHNVTILMTANSGTEMLATLAEDPEAMPEGDALVEMLRPELSQQFKPAFLGRLDVLPFLPLTPEILGGIVDLQISRIVDRTRTTHGTDLTISAAARDAMIERAVAGDTGARAIESMLARQVLPRLADYFLNSLARGLAPPAAEVDLGKEGAFVVSDGTEDRRKVS